jgi:3-deoxy-manno-octulosonate cytidylyltransferase (CMP-KDO synthetase)
MKAIGIIPARFGSTRFPGKPLALINGQPLLKWVIDGAKTSKLLSEIAVATDDERIAALARSSGVRALMTVSDLPTGTDRIYQAALQIEGLADDDVIVNIQGDEPLIDGTLLDRLVEPFREDAGLSMATLGRTLDQDSLHSPNTAKIILNKRGEAMYFSRLPIPFTRMEGHAPYEGALKHIGIYAYRRKFLRDFCAEKPAAIELAESLEQLRALYLGARIKVVRVEHDSWGVDTPDDILKIERLMRERTNAR